MTEDNVIRVANKPAMNYVVAVVTQANSGAKEVVIKARGNAISRAVDVVEIVRNRFLKDMVVKDIKIGTEQVQRENGTTMNVSAIEITLAKK
ncbi:MAG: DNA-binding protein Alba [Thermoplasmata archaeon]